VIRIIKAGVDDEDLKEVLNSLGSQLHCIGLDPTFILIAVGLKVFDWNWWHDSRWLLFLELKS